MAPLKNSSIPAVIILTMALFIHCTSTFTITEEPVFKGDINSVYSDITKLISCEEMNLSGKTVKTNGIASSILELSITNAKELSGDTAQMKALGKNIASTLKEALKDSNQYNTYTILFVTKFVDGSVTKEEWVATEFKSEEL